MHPSYRPDQSLFEKVKSSLSRMKILERIKTKATSPYHNLSEKQKTWFNAFIRTMDKKIANIEAGYGVNSTTPMQSTDLLTSIQEVMVLGGITDEMMIDVLKDSLKAKMTYTDRDSGEPTESHLPDYDTQLKGLRIAMELKGYGTPSKIRTRISASAEAPDNDPTVEEDMEDYLTDKYKKKTMTLDITEEHG